MINNIVYVLHIIQMIKSYFIHTVHASLFGFFLELLRRTVEATK